MKRPLFLLLTALFLTASPALLNGSIDQAGAAPKKSKTVTNFNRTPTSGQPSPRPWRSPNGRKRVSRSCCGGSGGR
ncbi:MAG: hypothetical protein ACR2OR_01755 [Hyphomicrobiales bacterium]